jgi:hypothetical protein
MLSFLRKQESSLVDLVPCFRRDGVWTPLEFIPYLLRGGSDSDLGFLSNPLNHFAFGDPVFIRPAELSGIQQGFL